MEFTVHVVGERRNPVSQQDATIVFGACGHGGTHKEDSKLVQGMFKISTALYPPLSSGPQYPAQPLPRIVRHPRFPMTQQQLHQTPDWPLQSQRWRGEVEQRAKHRGDGIEPE